MMYGVRSEEKRNRIEEMEREKGKVTCGDMCMCFFYEYVVTNINININTNINNINTNINNITY